MPRLGVNIDHIATLREVRKASYPDPFDALPILLKCGVDQVTLHLREDKRHIQDADVKQFIAAAKIPVNLEMAVTKEMVAFASRHKPHTCTFVPEKRQEITTEGGLNLFQKTIFISKAIQALAGKGIRVSLFIDPDTRQIQKASELGVEAIELHTGSYAEACGGSREKTELKRLQKAVTQAQSLGLHVFAGHGLTLKNVRPLVKIKGIEEYNIGHSIIARSVMVGLEKAIREMQSVLWKS